MKVLKVLFSSLALAFVLASCAQAPEPATITDENNCTENDRYKEDCQ